MRLTCVGNRAADLPDPQRPRGDTDETVYPLTAAKDYAALGMGLWENVLSILVRDDDGAPCFAPAAFFDVGTHQIPPDWRFGLSSGIRASGTQLWTDPRGAVWGYPELVNDPGHAAALEERLPEALTVFVARAAEAEAEHAADTWPPTGEP